MACNQFLYAIRKAFVNFFAKLNSWVVVKDCWIQKVPRLGVDEADPPIFSQ